MTKLSVNLNKVAWLRNARNIGIPSVTRATEICIEAGADGITVHLRQDRRHIQDKDIQLLREIVTTYLNVEMATTDEMIKIAVDLCPDAVSLVPENPNEITTEGGLDVLGNIENVRIAVNSLGEAKIFASIFIDPDEKQIEAAQKIGVQQIELCTAEYAELTLGAKSSHGEGLERAENELKRIKHAAEFAKSLGLIVAAGHGLTYRNVRKLAAMPEITEFNIGHNIVSRSIFVGLDQAVKEMIEAIKH